MSIFSNLKMYATAWSLKEERAFTAEEQNMVIDAYVVPSQYGNSVQFNMRNGGMTFIPLSRDATIGVGEQVDLSVAKIQILEKSGENDINRIMI